MLGQVSPEQRRTGASIPSQSVAVIKEVHNALFSPQLQEHRRARLIRYESEDVLEVIVLPFLSTVLSYFPKPTAIAVTACDVAIALMNDHLDQSKRSDKDRALCPVTRLLEKHNLSCAAVLTVLAAGTKRFFTGLKNLSKSKIFVGWLTADRMDFVQYVISMGHNIKWDSRYSMIFDGFGVAVGLCLPQSASDVLMHAHVLVLTKYASLTLLATSTVAVLNGNHRAPEKFVAVLESVLRVVCEERQALKALPMPKYYLQNLDVLLEHCRVNLKIQREVIAFGGIYEEFSDQVKEFASIGMEQYAVGLHARTGLCSLWDSMAKHSKALSDTFPNEFFVGGSDLFPTLTTSFLNWEDYLYRNHIAVKLEAAQGFGGHSPEVDAVKIKGFEVLWTKATRNVSGVQFFGAKVYVSVDMSAWGVARMQGQLNTLFKYAVKADRLKMEQMSLEERKWRKSPHKLGCRHVVLSWGHVEPLSDPRLDENVLFRPCRLHSVYVEDNQNAYTKAAVMFVEVTESFRSFYQSALEQESISPAPQRLCVPSASFDTHCAVLQTLEKLHAPNRHARAAKDPREDSPAPKSLHWPFCPKWIQNLLAGNKDPSDTFRAFQCKLPRGTPPVVKIDSFTLGATSEDLQRALQHVYGESYSMQGVSFAKQKKEWDIRDIRWPDSQKSIKVFVDDTLPLSCDTKNGKRSHYLYDAQRAAVISSLMSPMTVAIGPPGSGKTEIVLRIVTLLSKNFCSAPSRFRTLVCTHSDMALDRIFSDVAWLTTHSAKKENGRLWHPSFAKVTPDTSLGTIQSTDVVGMTCATAANMRRFIQHEYDILIIDEAGKFSQPESLVLFSFNPSRVIIVGDHLASKATLAEPMNNGRKRRQASLLEALLHRDIRPIFLDQQTRSTEALLKVFQWRYARDKTFHGTLQPFQHKRSIVPVYWRNSIFFPSHERLHDDEPSGAAVFVNIEEDSGIRRQFTQLGPGNICTILNHLVVNCCVKCHEISVLVLSQKEQRLLKTRLGKEMHLRATAVELVPDFEGKENNFVILSLNPCSMTESMMLTNSIWVNIMTSRARCNLVLIGNHTTFLNSEHWRPFINHFRLVDMASMMKHTVKAKEYAKQATKEENIRFVKGLVTLQTIVRRRQQRKK
jgi:hypothetical protein